MRQVRPCFHQFTLRRSALFRDEILTVPRRSIDANGRLAVEFKSIGTERSVKFDEMIFLENPEVEENRK